MALIAEALERRGYRLELFSPQSTAYWVAKLFGGGFESAAGISVTPETALTIATVYASCRNLAEDLASLPLPVYRDDTTTAGASVTAAIKTRKVVDRTAPAYRLLNVMANPEMTAMSFKETIHGHNALRGDGFAEKELDQALRPKALWPLNPSRIRMARNGSAGLNVSGAPAGALFYIYTLPSGEQKVLSSDLIFHSRGFGPDGLRGYSIVALARESMGVALATEQYGARFFANDARPGVVLQHPKSLSDKARTNLELSWRETHQGLDNAHRIAILEEGLTVQKVGIDPVDAQFLETQKLERDFIASWFRMPPDKIGNFERATYSNMEQSDINYVRYTLMPRATRFEQQLSADNVVDANHYALHDFSQLTRGDSTARAAFYHSLRQDGAISGEDIRRMENYDPSGQPAADELLVPLNMMPASAFGTNGLTMFQIARAARDFLFAGYEAESVNKVLGLGDMKHTGVVPGKATPDPDAAWPEGSDPTANPDQGSGDGGSGDGSDSNRSNGHRSDLDLALAGSV